MIGPAPSPHEKALRLRPLRLLGWFELLRLDVPPWVRVAIFSSLAGTAVTTASKGASFLVLRRCEDLGRRSVIRRLFRAGWTAPAAGMRAQLRLPKEVAAQAWKARLLPAEPR